MKPARKIILSDIGGVLLKVNFEIALKRLGEELILSKDQLEDKIFSSELKEKHDLGLIDSQEFYRKIVLGEKIPYAFFQLIWSEIFTENSKIIQYVASCRKKFDLYISSNTDPLHFSYFCKNYKWISIFQGFGLSFQLHATKPSAAFYENLCRQFNINYQEALFIDDLPANVEACRGSGD